MFIIATHLYTLFPQEQSEQSDLSASLDSV